MSETVEAVLMTAPGRPLELRHVPSPWPQAGGAVLETVASEICGTDVHLWHGRLSGVPYPIIPGHVSVGVAAGIHGLVKSVDGRTIAEGDRLAFFDVHRTCGRCRACTVTRTPTRCESRRVYGVTDS